MHECHMHNSNIRMILFCLYIYLQIDKIVQKTQLHGIMNLFFTLAPTMTATKAPYVTVNDDSIHINDNNVTLTLSWEEPFNNLDPIVNYIVSCSGDVTCPPNFTTAVRSYIITNLTPMTNYTFSVVAINSIGSGEAGVVMITTPPGKLIRYYMPMFLFCKHTYL